MGDRQTEEQRQRETGTDTGTDADADTDTVQIVGQGLGHGQGTAEADEGERPGSGLGRDLLRSGLEWCDWRGVGDHWRRFRGRLSQSQKPGNGGPARTPFLNFGRARSLALQAGA